MHSSDQFVHRWQSSARLPSARHSPEALVEVVRAEFGNLLTPELHERLETLPSRTAIAPSCGEVLECMGHLCPEAMTWLSPAEFLGIHALDAGLERRCWIIGDAETGGYLDELILHEWLHDFCPRAPVVREVLGSPSTVLVGEGRLKACLNLPFEGFRLTHEVEESYAELGTRRYLMFSRETDGLTKIAPVEMAPPPGGESSWFQFWEACQDYFVERLSSRLTGKPGLRKPSYPWERFSTALEAAVQFASDGTAPSTQKMRSEISDAFRKALLLGVLQNVDTLLGAVPTESLCTSLGCSLPAQRTEASEKPSTFDLFRKFVVSTPTDFDAVR